MGFFFIKISKAQIVNIFVSNGIKKLGLIIYCDNHFADKDQALYLVILAPSGMSG